MDSTWQGVTTIHLRTSRNLKKIQFIYFTYLLAKSVFSNKITCFGKVRITFLWVKMNPWQVKSAQWSSKSKKSNMDWVLRCHQSSAIGDNKTLIKKQQQQRKQSRSKYANHNASILPFWVLLSVNSILHCAGSDLGVGGGVRGIPSNTLN